MDFQSYLFVFLLCALVQFIAEQLLTATHILYAFRLCVRLKKEIFKSKRGNCVFRRPVVRQAQRHVAYRGEREATAVLTFRQSRTPVDKEAMHVYALLQHYRINS